MPEQRKAEQSAFHSGPDALDCDLSHHHDQPAQTDGDVQPVAADEGEEGGKKGAALRRRAASDHVGELADLQAQESGSELAVSVLCANEAWAYAMMGNEEQAVKLLGRSKDEFERANLAEAESWVKFFTETDVYAMIGTVHTVLAQKNSEHTKFAIPALTPIPPPIG